MIITAIPPVLSTAPGAFVLYSVASRILELSLAAMVLRMLIYHSRRGVSITNIPLSHNSSIHNISALTYSEGQSHTPPIVERAPSPSSPLSSSTPISAPITTTNYPAGVSNITSNITSNSSYTGNAPNAATASATGGTGTGDGSGTTAVDLIRVNYWRKPLAWMFLEEPASGRILWSRSGSTQDSSCGEGNRTHKSVWPSFSKNTVSRADAPKFSTLSRNSSSDDSTDSGNIYFV